MITFPKIILSSWLAKQLTRKSFRFSVWALHFIINVSPYPSCPSHIDLSKILKFIKKMPPSPFFSYNFHDCNLMLLNNADKMNEGKITRLLCMDIIRNRLVKREVLSPTVRFLPSQTSPLNQSTLQFQPFPYPNLSYRLVLHRGFNGVNQLIITISLCVYKLFWTGFVRKSPRVCVCVCFWSIRFFDLPRGIL